MTRTVAEPQVVQAASEELVQEHSLRRILGSAANYWELRKTPYGLGPILVFTFLSFFNAIHSQVVSFAGGFAAPNIAQDLHFSLGQVISIVVSAQLILVFAAIPFAYFVDRSRRATWIGIGTLVSSLTLLVQSRAFNLQSFGVPVAVGTVGDTLSETPGTSLIADYYPPEARGRVFALNRGIRQVGILAATVVGGVLVARYGWRLLNTVLALPILAMSVVAFIVLREPVRGYFERRAFGLGDDAARKEDPPLGFEESFRAVLSVRTVRRLFAADLFDNVAALVYGVYIPFFLAEYYGLDVFQRALISVPFLICGFAGAYFGGGLVDIFTRIAPSSVLRIVGGASLVGALASLVVGLAPPLPVLIAVNSVGFLVVSATNPVSFALTSQVLPPNTRTLGLAFLNLASVPAALSLDLIFQPLQQNYGFTPMFMVAIPFAVIAALIRISAADFFDFDRRQQIIGAGAAAEWKELQTEAVAAVREAVARGEVKGSAAAASVAPPILICRNIDVSYGGTQVLFGVDFEVREGEIVALLGTNGAGKSTLLRAISGTQEASGGSIIFDGREITHKPPHETASLGLVMMPGGRGTFSGLTVRDNLELGSWIEHDRRELADKLRQIYELFPVLKQKGRLPAGALSGGEQQMLSLSQAFLSEPKLLLIDELSLGLSPAVVGELLAIVKQIQAQGTAVVIVEQSVNVALTVAERAAFMEKGEVKFVGPTADLLRRPDILRAVYVKGTATASTGEAIVVESARRRREQELERANAVLEVEGISKSFGGVVALDGVSLTLRQGEVLGLIGPNGSGKTTLLDVISGEVRPEAGRVRYKGVDITGLPAEERARRKLIRRFQDANLFPSLTVYETLLIALDQKLEVRNTLLGAIALPQARRAERRVRVRADRLLELLALGPYRDKFVSELSTGLRRILDLAFVLATEAEVLLLDEPSSGIAQAEAEGLGPLIRRIRFETGCSILIIEHDIPLITAVSDELVALNLGHVQKRGTAEEVLNDPAVIEAFLGGSEAAIRRSGAVA